ncbi:MAG TPA: hypothetical protein VLA74_06490 [Nitrososphaeraceae archaeon]|nr:hypothetical protein [Nitrososphaeraceae archaeon]
MNSIKISLFSTMILSIFSITILISIPNARAEENSCISFDAKENEISISCKYANFIDIEDKLQNKTLLYFEPSTN